MRDWFMHWHDIIVVLLSGATIIITVAFQCLYFRRQFERDRADREAYRAKQQEDLAVVKERQMEVLRRLERFDGVVPPESGGP